MTDFIPYPERGYISHSSTRLYKECERKWAWKYIHGLEGGKPSRGRIMGKMFGEGLEAHYNGHDGGWESHIESGYNDLVMGAGEQVEVDEYENQRAIVSSLVAGYVGVYPDKLQRELDFSVDIPSTDYTSNGFIDGVCYEGGYLVEDKLLVPQFWGDNNVKALALDDQVTGYHWAAWRDGIEILDTRYRVTLKPGVRRRQSRNPETNAEFRTRVQEDIESRPEHYFREYKLSRTISDLVEYEAEMVRVIEQMDESVSKDVYTQNSSNCAAYGGCEFLDTCLRLRSSDG
jgi:hypothetical protein